MALPPIDYQAPPLNAVGLGLYAAATLVDSATRLSGGVIIHPYNCGTNVGSWPSDPCATPEPDARKSGERTAPGDPFLPITLWGYDECDLIETDEQLLGRAQHGLMLTEEQHVAEAFKARADDDAGAAVAADDIVSAVADIEAALATDPGVLGVIVADAVIAAHAESAGLIIRSGSSLRTPLGHRWAFVGGDVFGGDLYGVVGLTVWRDAVTAVPTIDARTNTRAAVAERTIVVGYECVPTRVTIEGTP